MCIAGYCLNFTFNEFGYFSEASISQIGTFFFPAVTFAITFIGTFVIQNSSFVILPKCLRGNTQIICKLQLLHSSSRIGVRPSARVARVAIGVEVLIIDRKGVRPPTRVARIAIGVEVLIIDREGVRPSTRVARVAIGVEVLIIDREEVRQSTRVARIAIGVEVLIIDREEVRP